MKYILEIKPEYEANGIMILGARDSHLYVTTLEVKDLEELNSDYINEHFGDLQDTAYKKGFEDGKAVHDKGCEGCLYNDGAKEHSPCDICRNAYLNRWTAKQTDDEIKVGDVVMIKHSENHLFVVTKVSSENVWGVEGDGSWNYWPINEVIKTDKHFDIDKILEEMRHD